MPQFTPTHVTLTSEVLAALAIVASGSTYLYQNWWKDRQIELTARVASSTPKVLSLLATNTGGKDIVVTSATVSSTLLGEKIATKLELKEGGELIKKGESALLSPVPANFSAVVQASKRFKQDDMTAKTTCVADIEYVGPNGDPQVIHTSFQCYAACIVELPQK